MKCLRCRAGREWIDEGAAARVLSEPETRKVLKRVLRDSFHAERKRLAKENAALRAALEEIVGKYIANRGTAHEFISCITPGNRRESPKSWAMWDRARRALGEKFVRRPR